MVETKRICNGTFGEVWLDGSYVGECYKAQGKVEFNPLQSQYQNGYQDCSDD